jgi:hypothetical protein
MNCLPPFILHIARDNSSTNQSVFWKSWSAYDKATLSFRCLERFDSTHYSPTAQTVFGQSRSAELNSQMPVKIRWQVR